jgi:TetR/AcrR family transcriptional regulator, transcriptional repressor of bet genes
MTQRVDHEQRRRQIAEALWRIAASRGLHDVGLREVATEAGISLGALQHYFSSKDDMLVFTLEFIGQEAEHRVRDRLANLAGPPSPEAVVRETLAEMLPLSPQSWSGLLVHVAYLARAVHDQRLRAVTVERIPALRDLLAEMLRRAAEAGRLTPGRDPDTEAMTLICLAEGVTNYVLLETLTAAEGQHLVDAHLAGLFGAVRELPGEPATPGCDEHEV